MRGRGLAALSLPTCWVAIPSGGGSLRIELPAVLPPAWVGRAGSPAARPVCPGGFCMGRWHQAPACTLRGRVWLHARHKRGVGSIVAGAGSSIRVLSKSNCHPSSCAWVAAQARPHPAPSALAIPAAPAWAVGTPGACAQAAGGLGCAHVMKLGLGSMSAGRQFDVGARRQFVLH